MRGIHAMTERRLIATADEVRGFLAGTRTKIKRPVKWRNLKHSEVVRVVLNGEEAMPFGGLGGDAHYVDLHVKSPFGVPGDRLWVAETWGIFDSDTFGAELAISYKADEVYENAADCTWYTLPKEYAHKYCMTIDGYCSVDELWRPSTQMPRWACRIVQDVKAVRVERDGDQWVWIGEAKRVEVGP